VCFEEFFYGQSILELALHACRLSFGVFFSAINDRPALESMPSTKRFVIDLVLCMHVTHIRGPVHPKLIPFMCTITYSSFAPT
jgi:hypothetical protein